MIIRGLILMLLTGTVAASTVELQDEEEIAVARRLDSTVDGLVAKVRQCAAAGLAPASQCHCYYPAKLNSTMSIYNDIIAAHPEWEDRTLLWWEGDRAYPSNVQLRGVKMRFAQPCS